MINHFGIFGILSLYEKDLYLIVITNVSPAGTCPRGKKIFQIQRVEALPFVQKSDSDVKKDPHLKGILKIIEEQNFYFSYFTDLTNSQENSSQNRIIFRDTHPGQKRDALWWRKQKVSEDVMEKMLKMKKDEQKNFFDRDDSFIGDLPSGDT